MYLNRFSQKQLTSSCSHTNAANVLNMCVCCFSTVSYTQFIRWDSKRLKPSRLFVIVFVEKCMPTCQKDYMRISSSFRVFCSTWKWEACSHEHVASFGVHVFDKRRETQIDADKERNMWLCATFHFLYNIQICVFALHKQEKHAYVFGQAHANQLHSSLMYVHVKIADGPERESDSGVGVSVCKSRCVHRCSPNMPRYVVSFGGCKLNTCFSAKISIFSYDFRLMCAIAFAAFEGGVCAWDSLHSPHITVTTRSDTTRRESNSSTVHRGR